MATEHFLNTAAAARLLAEEHGFPVAENTLRKLRCVGGGPHFHKFGRSVVYRASDLLEWAFNRLGKPLTSTSANSVGGAVGQECV